MFCIAFIEPTTSPALNLTLNPTLSPTDEPRSCHQGNFTSNIRKRIENPKSKIQNLSFFLNRNDNVRYI